MPRSACTMIPAIATTTSSLPCSIATPLPSDDTAVAPVTSATRPDSDKSVILRLQLGHHVHGDLEARHVDHLVGVELDVELVLDGRDQRHVADRVPRLDVAVLQVLDVHTAVEVQRLDEDLAQLGGDFRHQHS